MNPHPQSILKKDEKISFHWWNKIKALFLGQWLQIRKSREESKGSENSDCDDLILNHMTLINWIEATDILAFLVQSLRRNLELKANDEIDLEALGASTYLFHIDRLSVKVREHFQGVRAEEPSFDNSSHIVQQIRKLGEQCYQRILYLTTLIQQCPIKKIYTDKLIDQVHLFELEVTALGSAIRTFSQNSYKAQAILHLASIEQELLQALQNRYSFQNVPFSMTSHRMLCPSDEYLRSKTSSLADCQSKILINGMIDIYQRLKKCYVLARRAVIKESIDKMAQHIESLIDLSLQNELNKHQAYYHVNQLFHCIESLRFLANNDGISKNLFNNSKWAYTQLRKICQKNTLGLEYLKQYSIKRVTLQKPR